jgi:hypothetical protein
MPLSLEQQIAVTLLAQGRHPFTPSIHLLRTDLTLLGDALFIRHPETLMFLQRDGLRLASQLRRRTQSARIVTEGSIRGKIEWSATYQQRATGAHRYVCREVQADYDQLENQCLTYLLAQIKDGLRRLDGIVETSRVTSQYVALMAILPPPNAIYTPHTLTTAHHQALRQARSNEYRSLSTLIRYHQKLRVQPDPNYFCTCLSEHCPIPISLKDFIET